MAGENRTRRIREAAQDREDYSHDTEITLGTGKMLGVFFALVVLCGLFFGVGYMIGHNSARIEAHNTDPAAADSALATAGGKPSASPNEGTPSAESPSSASTALADSSGTSIGPRVEVRDTTTGVPITTTTDSPAPTVSATKNHPVTTVVTAQNAATHAAVSVAAASPATTANGTWWVQVAAVSRSEDANVLVTALKRKQYTASAVTNAPSDKLFHVQVGPFAGAVDADAMKKRLLADGYNAIVKK